MGEAIAAIIAAALDVTSKSLELVNRKEKMKYVDKLHLLRLQLLEEESLGYNSDDARIEKLYGEIKITLETLRNELNALSVDKSSSN